MLLQAEPLVGNVAKPCSYPWKPPNLVKNESFSIQAKYSKVPLAGSQHCIEANLSISFKSASRDELNHSYSDHHRHLHVMRAPSWLRRPDAHL